MGCYLLAGSKLIQFRPGTRNNVHLHVISFHKCSLPCQKYRALRRRQDIEDFHRLGEESVTPVYDADVLEVVVPAVARVLNENLLPGSSDRF